MRPTILFVLFLAAGCSRANPNAAFLRDAGDDTGGTSGGVTGQGGGSDGGGTSSTGGTSSSTGGTSSSTGGTSSSTGGGNGDGGSSADLALPDQQAPDGLELVSGTPGSSGFGDGIGTAARFTFVGGLATDGSGNLYVGDEYNHLIRKVVLATGAVSTLAGAPGVEGSSDGVGSAARLGLPRGLTIAGGFLYFTDSNTIRRIDPASGQVTTVAGQSGMGGDVDGVGAAARLDSPTQLTSDGAGTLYFTDAGANSLRKLVLSSGAVTTLVHLSAAPGGLAYDGSAGLFFTVGNAVEHYFADGTRLIVAGSEATSGAADGVGTAARFYQPSSLALDGSDNLYISDGNYAVRRLSLQTRVVSTLAGTLGAQGKEDGVGAAARFYYVGSLALDAAGNLHVGDADSVRRVTIASALVETIAGANRHHGYLDGAVSAALFSYPAAVVADGVGTLYVSDSGNQVVRKITSGVVSTLATGFSSPAGLALDGNSLYVVDGSTNAVKRIALPGGAVSLVAGGTHGSADGVGAAASFAGPSGAALDGQGNLFVADSANHTIRKIALASGAVSTLAGTAGSQGNSDGIGATARFYYPSDVVFDGVGALYVADQLNDQVRRVTVAGAVTTVPVTIVQPRALAYRAGSLFVISDSTIRRINLATNLVSVVVGDPARHGVLPGPLPASLNAPSALAVLPSGELAITDENESVVLQTRGLP